MLTVLHVCVCERFVKLDTRLAMPGAMLSMAQIVFAIGAIEPWALPGSFFFMLYFLRVSSQVAIPGEFLYPTDVATGPDGSIWVSEYGGNDRVQVFNADGSLRRVIGAVGDRPGEFSRPQAIALSPDGGVAKLICAEPCPGSRPLKAQSCHSRLTHMSHAPITRSTLRRACWHRGSAAR